MPKRPVVFDLDGTLVDSRRDIAQAANHVLERLGRAPLPLATVMGFVGDGARALVAKSLDLPESAPELDQHLEIFLDYYTDHAVDHTTLMPGTTEVLEALRGRPLALCTNKSRRTTLPVLEGLGLLEKFQAIVAGGDTPEVKPHAAPLLRVAELLGVRPEELVMVGDGPQDILAARAVGALAVGVRGGILPEERLLSSAPDVVLDRLSELVDYLERANA